MDKADRKLPGQMAREPAQSQRRDENPRQNQRETSPDDESQAAVEAAESEALKHEYGQSGLSQNETTDNSKSQHVVQQEVTTTDPEEPETEKEHPSPQEGVPQASPKRARKRPGAGSPISNKQKETLFYELCRGASLRSAAAQAGCAHSVVVRLMQQDEHFAACVARYQEHLMRNLIRKLDIVGNRDWRAAARLLDFLERRAVRMEERERSRFQQREA